MVRYAAVLLLLLTAGCASVAPDSRVPQPRRAPQAAATAARRHTRSADTDAPRGEACRYARDTGDTARRAARCRVACDRDTARCRTDCGPGT